MIFEYFFISMSVIIESQYRNMFRLVLVIISVLLIYGCNNSEDREEEITADDIIQNQNGNIILSLKDAYLLSDKDNPHRNTAEWGFTVNSKGRYEVWLSSFTKDTMNLSYLEPVIVHFGDKKLESQPVGNKIVLDDDHVSEPYFRADSRLGSILIEDSGHYNIQIISEKVLPSMGSKLSVNANTILDQIILKPQEY